MTERRRMEAEGIRSFPSNDSEDVEVFGEEIWRDDNEGGGDVEMGNLFTRTGEGIKGVIDKVENNGPSYNDGRNTCAICLDDLFVDDVKSGVNGGEVGALKVCGHR